MRNAERETRDEPHSAMERSGGGTMGRTRHPAPKVADAAMIGRCKLHHFRAATDMHSTIQADQIIAHQFHIVSASLCPSVKGQLTTSSVIFLTHMSFLSPHPTPGRPYYSLIANARHMSPSNHPPRIVLALEVSRSLAPKRNLTKSSRSLPPVREPSRPDPKYVPLSRSPRAICLGPPY